MPKCVIERTKRRFCICRWSGQNLDKEVKCQVASYCFSYFLECQIAVLLDGADECLFFPFLAPTTIHNIAGSCHFSFSTQGFDDTLACVTTIIWKPRPAVGNLSISLARNVNLTGLCSNMCLSLLWFFPAWGVQAWRDFLINLDTYSTNNHYISALISWRWCVIGGFWFFTFCAIYMYILYYSWIL